MIKWITSRYATKCRHCQATIMVGDSIAFLNPGRKALCRPCGRRQQARGTDRVELTRQALAAARRLGEPLD